MAVLQYVAVDVLSVTGDSAGAAHGSQPVHFRQQKKLKTKAKPFIEPTGVHVCIKWIQTELTDRCFFSSDNV